MSQAPAQVANVAVPVPVPVSLSVPLSMPPNPNPNPVPLPVLAQSSSSLSQSALSSPMAIAPPFVLKPSSSSSSSSSSSASLSSAVQEEKKEKKQANEKVIDVSLKDEEWWNALQPPVKQLMEGFSIPTHFEQVCFYAFFVFMIEISMFLLLSYSFLGGTY